MGDLQTAQAQLDEKEAELAKVRALYDQAMAEKQVLIIFNLDQCMFCILELKSSISELCFTDK